ncbi:MAG TPA: hypothetical protein DCW90_19340 [Lachnospiraceae bacterium]|nr:radical SAM protein [uncultured Lachnoclostridium sp.]HAU87559.1 hypothetical protein [Lachnospiraceae bacterium]
MNYVQILQDSEYKVYYTQSGQILKIPNDRINSLIDKIEKEKFTDTGIEPFIKTHKLRKLAILINNSCNLRCGYCYMDYGNISGNSTSVSIDLNHLRIALENVFRLYEEGIEYIQFFGGEPLLDFEKLESIIHIVNELCQKRNISCPNYGIVTNGISLTENMVRAINENNVSLTISIDGPKEIHDAVRINITGHGSFIKVKDVVEQYQHKMKNPIIYEMTINNEHVKHYEDGAVKRWMDEVKSMGLQVGIICLVENSKDNSLNITEQELSIVEKIYQEIVDYFIDELLSGKENIMVNTQIIEIIQNISKKQCQHRTCGPGLTQLTFTADGSVAPCTYMLEDIYKLGDFSSEMWQSEKVTQLVKNEFRSKCKKCWATNLCNNFCYIRKENIQYEGRNISSKCLANLLLIKRVLSRIIILQKEGKIAKINAGIRRCNKILGRYNVK